MSLLLGFRSAALQVRFERILSRLQPFVCPRSRVLAPPFLADLVPGVETEHALRIAKLRPVKSCCLSTIGQTQGAGETPIPSLPLLFTTNFTVPVSPLIFSILFFSGKRRDRHRRGRMGATTVRRERERERERAFI